MPLLTKPKTATQRFNTLTVNAILRGIVNEKPEGYRYTGPDGAVCTLDAPIPCYYADHNGKPSCLVGQVAARLGIPLPGWDNQMVNASAVSDQTREYGDMPSAADEWLSPYFTTEALKRLHTVQQRQDKGETWARSIR